MGYSYEHKIYYANITIDNRNKYTYIITSYIFCT